MCIVLEVDDMLTILMETCLGSTECLILIDHRVYIISLHTKLTIEIYTKLYILSEYLAVIILIILILNSATL